MKSKILDLMHVLKFAYFKNITYLKGVSLAFMIIHSELFRTKIDSFVSFQIMRQSTFSTLGFRDRLRCSSSESMVTVKKKSL